jgi:prolipoprotein diacylglyceryltransferase
MIGNILGIIYWKFFFQFDSVPLEFTGFQGLASHGAAISIIVAMYFLVKKNYNAPTLDLRPNSNSSC